MFLLGLRHTTIAVAAAVLVSAVAAQAPDRPRSTGSTSQPTGNPTETQPTKSAVTTQDFEALLRDVTKAHRGGETSDEPLGQFAGELSILPLGRDVERIEVKLQARFLAPQLLRYQVTEQGKRLERGIDRAGPWARTNKQAYSLGGRDFAQDRESLRQHVRLASLLLSFLDPGAILRSLENRADVTRRTLTPGRGKPLGPYRFVRGDYRKFPFYRAEGASNRARLEAWIDDEGVLQAVRATPIDDSGKALAESASGGEMILFANHREHDGVLVPTRLTVFDVGAGPRRPAQGAKIEISRLDLRPVLTEASFIRPD